MRIGVLSDSHGRVEITRRAVAALRAAGAEQLIHLGDFETEDVIDELAGHSARIVFGNCDWDVARLTTYARRLDVAVDHPCGDLTIDGRRVVYTHGHLVEPMEAAIRDGAAFLLHGHTHEARDERIDRTRVVNPGALFRAARYTAALLDVGADRVEFIEIPK